MFRTSFSITTLSFSIALIATPGCDKGAPDEVTPPDVVTESDTAPAAAPTSVLMPVEGEATVNYRLSFAVGSQDDPPGKEGLAWMTAQLVTDGATEQHEFAEITEMLFPMATGYGANVDREMTTISGRVHLDHRPAYEELLAQAITTPKFADADLERIRARALSSIGKSLRYARDEELAKAAFFDFVFSGTRYAHPSMGTVQGLTSITADDVREFWKTHYTQDRLTLGLAGGYGDASVQRLQAMRDQLAPTGAPRVEAPAVAPIENRHLRLVHKPGADASISFGFPIDVHRGEKDFYALWLANSWLGEHRNSSSHLYQVIREARGMNYGDYSYIEAFPNGGWRSMPPVNVARRQQLFEVWIRTLPNEQAHFALRAAMREVERLHREGMSAEEFALMKEFLPKYSRHFADTISAQLGYAIDDRFYGIEGSHLDNMRDIIGSLTIEDVNGAIKRHLDPSNLKIVISTGEPEKLRDAIVGEAPSPMTYASPKPQTVLDEDKEIETHPLGVDAERVTIVAVEEMFEK
jgi:zinc protease